jgi:hypothetical protein
VSATSQDIAREVDRFIRERGVTKLPAAYAAESTASLSESDRAALHARPPEVESIATSAHAKSVKRKLAAETDPTKKAEMQRRLDAYSKRLGMAISAGKRRHAAASTSPRAISVTVPSPKPKSQEKPAMPSALRAVTPPVGASSPTPSSFKIETGIPMPVTTRGIAFPFRDLRIGESFLVPGGTQKKLNGARTKAMKETGFRFAIRAVDGGARVWRVS